MLDPKTTPIVCHLAADCIGKMVIPPEITETSCVRCGRAVLIAPSTRELIDGGDAQPVCNECILVVAADVPIAVHPDQVADMKKYGAATGQERN